MQIKHVADGTDLSDAVNLQQLSNGIGSLSDVYQEKGNYLTSVPTEYKTYDATVSQLSSNGYLISSDIESTLGSIPVSEFSNIASPGASVRSIQETLT